MSGPLADEVSLVAGATRGAGRGIAIEAWSGRCDRLLHRTKHGFTDGDGSQPDVWRYLVEVQDAGKPADVTGYR